jgi:UDP-N-acetylmuramate--alanine ligase
MMAALSGTEAWMDVDLRALARTGPVHFVGIGGAGMSALADLLLRAGGQVTGCDMVTTGLTAALAARGAHITRGHDPAHVAHAVAVVATSAMRPDHPELTAARARGIPVLKRAQALGALVNRGTVIAVAGTHGKTTTTAMISGILSEAALDPTAFVGGQVTAWGSGLRSGSETLFVVEADEYDRSFLTLRPTVVVVTSIEADHLDVYGSFEHIEEAFRELVGRVPEGGLLVACVDDAGARRVLDVVRGRALGYGTAEDAELRATDLRTRGHATTFTVTRSGERLGDVTVGVPGVHNVRNALAALAVAAHLDAGLDAARRALADFHGVERRFQELGTVRGIAVIDDYAHHPTEIAATLAAARMSYPDRPLVAVFQPHLYSRTRDFARAFGEALAAADRVWVTDVYAAREAPIEGVTGRLVADAAVAAGAAVQYEPSLDVLIDGLLTSLRAGDVCVAMGAGSIDQATRTLIERLRAAGAT